MPPIYDDYSLGGEDRERLKIYDYVRSLAALPTDEAVDTFYRMLWSGNVHPREDVKRALNQVVRSPDFKQDRLKVINRCYYTLANPWHLQGDRGTAIANLIGQLDDKPSNSRAHDPLTKELRSALQAYRDSSSYTILQRHLYLLWDREKPEVDLQVQGTFGNLFPEYFYIYEAGTQTPDIEKLGGNLSSGVREKRNSRLMQYRNELCQFYVRAGRSPQTPPPNPTRLPAGELWKLINLYKPNNAESFVRQACQFKEETAKIDLTSNFKGAAYSHIMRPVRSLGRNETRWMSSEFQKVLTYIDDDVPLTPLVKIQVFRRLLDVIFSSVDSCPGADRFWQLLSAVGHRMVTSILLNILLACGKIRYAMEKRFARLYYAHLDRDVEEVSWLVRIFEHINVALALNCNHLGYAAA